MKKIMMTLAAVCVAATMNAQWYIGGGLGLNISKIQITLGYDQGLFNLDTSDDGSKIIKSYAKAGIAYLF